MKGSLTASLVSAFGLLALVWGNTAVITMPVSERVAQGKTGTGINRPQLKAGSQGVTVSELQAALKLLGYYTGAVDGVYGESTAIAVSQFQQAAGLNPNGIVSPETWEHLFPLAPLTAPSTVAFPVPSTSTTALAPKRSAPSNTRVTNSKPPAASGARLPISSASTPANLPILRLGMGGSSVKRLQQRLQAIGLFKGSIDGVFGSKTEAAVKAAQRRYRLKPDGVVGLATWKALIPQPLRSQ